MSQAVQIQGIGPTGGVTAARVDANGSLLVSTAGASVGTGASVVSDVTSVKVGGATIVRDPSKDEVYTYGDGTTETLYFNVNGKFAGSTPRA